MRSVRAALLAGVLSAGFLAAVPLTAAHGSATSPAAAAPTTSLAPSGQSGTHLGKHDRQLLATAVADKKKTVSLLIASTTGNNATVAAELQQLGAVVRSRADSVDYLRVIVPTAKAEQAAELAGVQAANLDDSQPIENPAPPKASTQDVAPPSAGTPAQNPYLPTNEIGAPQFRAAHPTYDGRGVVMGILDSGIDLLTPELQSAMTATGAPTRKIVDWVTETDPLTDNDPTWVNMADQVTANGGTFSYHGATYTAPADGTYRIGIFDERNPALGGELGNDVNRDGNPPGSSGLFGVLWNTTTNTVWVDANQNHSFADQAAMTDYKVHQDVGVFGTDNPATPQRETVPFVVQTDGPDKYVNIGIVSGLHGTHVAGIAAGNGFFGGAFDGAAPQAQLVSVRVCNFIEPSCTRHGEIEGAIYAEKTDNVDVINESVGGLAQLNDGNDTASLVYNRLIDQSKGEMFLSAGNSGPGLNTVAAPGVATEAVEVGASLSKQTMLDDFGSVLDKDMQLWSFSSRGPREDGGFKPNIVAPGTAFSTVPAWEPPEFTFCFPYDCPTGYTVESGTSMAAPMAAGGAALLISGAKQSGVQWAPDQLREAIYSSTRFLPGYGAHEQGNGLLQVGAAWALLRQNLKTVGITSSAPVNAVLSAFLQTPNRGPGIYQREGWAAGDDRTLGVTLTRTTGGTKAITYALSWIGNDGTFSGPVSVALGRSPVTVPVRVHPVGNGAHSAILVVDDPATPGIDFETLNTVVAAAPLSAADGYSADATGTIDRADGAETFFAVPPGVSALVSTLHLSSGEAHIYQLDPTGAPYPGVSQNESFYCDGPCDVSIAAQNPPPGVWDISVESAPLAPGSEIGFDVNVSAVTVGIDPPAWTVDPASVGTAYQQTFTVHNEFGPFVGNASGTSLGDAWVTRPTITASGGQQVYPVTVPPGSTRIAASIGNASDPNADLDLYLFDCSSGFCQLAALSATQSANEAVQVFGPSPGTWVVLVDPYSVPSGSTAYDYAQTVFNPANGLVSVSDPPALHPSGSSWLVSASVTPNVIPPPGHFLQGFVRIVSPTVGQLALAEVDLRNLH